MTNESFFPSLDILHATGSAQTELHQRAAESASRLFNKQVFVRAVVEISNFCRENCSYCGMRRDNRKLKRIRANPKELADLILKHRPASVTDINLQAGEDPIAVREVALPLIEILRRETNLGISVCLGTLNPRLYQELQAAGASIYIIKFEIGNRDLYARLQAPGTYDERLENIRHLAGTGWNVSSGFIAGLPTQTDEQMLENFRVAAELPLDGCSVSPFIPGDETLWASAPTSKIDLTLNSMAALRLMRPDWIIPAVSALNISEPEHGYRRGLRTGANLVTINMTPGEIRDDYLLYKRERFIMTEERILSAIQSEQLTPSKESLADYYRRKKGILPKTVAIAA